MVDHTGACQCGSVKFTAHGAPKFISNCHCAACRKATGAAFSTWVGFEQHNIQWLKEPPSFYQSSPGVKRGFCPSCGTPMTYAGEKWPGETHLMIGAFDDPSGFVPRKEVFTDEALDWALPNKDHE